MHIGTREGLAVALGVVALVGLAAGCEGEKKNEAVDAGAQDAGPQQPVIGGKLGAALASAAAGSGAPSSSGAAADGPPEGGVFAKGAGARALPPGTPYTINVLGDGAEPRSKLALRLDPKAEQKIGVTLGLRMGGPQMMPNVDLEVAFKVDKPTKSKAGDKAGPGPEQAPAGTPVTGKVISATLASMGLGGPPKEASEEIATLKGSVIRYQLSPTNAASDFKVELSKKAGPGLEPVIQALVEAISLLTTPLPDKPVGVGAYWMVTDRAVWSGAQIPMLRYRIFKIEKIDGGTVQFSVDTRQYAEEAIAKIPNGGQELSLGIDVFDSSGKGSLTWDATSLAPRSADLTQPIQARLVPPGPKGNQRMSIQAELNAKFRLPAAPPP